MRLIRAAAVLLVLFGVTARAQQSTQPPDAVTQLITALQTAISGNDVSAFRALASPRLAELEGLAFELAFLSGGVTAATVKERDRGANAEITRVLAEFLINRNGAGQIATWQIDLSGTGAVLRIEGLHQVSSISGLHRLELDTSTAFDVNNFVFNAIDFRLTKASGTAFVAKTSAGVTAIVLRGHGQMHFEPSDPIERRQLKRYAKTEVLTDPVDAVFLRINPSEYQSRISDGSLRPLAASTKEINRARDIFNQWASRSYNVTLGDLSAERWTLLPAPGDALADMLTRHFRWLSYSRAVSQNEDVSLIDREAHKNISVYASPGKIATRGRFYSEDDDRTYDIEHYDLNVRFAPERSMVGGTATVRLRMLRHDADSITLRLAEPLAVESLTSEGYGRLLHLRVVGQDSVIVSFPEPQPVGKIVTLSMTYQGRLVPQSLSREAAMVTAQDRPEGGWVASQENAIPPEPNYAYSNNSYWYPQSTVTDYATARIRVTVPQDFQAVSSGTVVDEDVVGTDRVATFVADTPARYLSTIMSRLVPLPRTTVVLPSGKTLTIDARSNPRQFGGTKTLSSRAAEIIKFYASIIGEVPYPSFTLLSLESEVPGGHSPAYFAAINQPTPTTTFTWRNDPIAFDDTFPNFYLAHEIAHQWWGQGVGVKNYHDQWLSEGLAQYFAYRYSGADRGLAVQQSILERMRKSVRRFGDSGPISLGYRLGHAVGDGSNFRAIVYNKSVIVLDMLREMIGDEAFTAGLRRFYQTWKFQKAGTDDLRQAFEAEARQPLGRFFDRWVLDDGFPALTLTSVVETSGQAVLVRIEQTGDIFDMPATIAIGYADLPTEFVTLPLHAALTELRVPLKGRIQEHGIRLVPKL
jgi:hypothetical protein